MDFLETQYLYLGLLAFSLAYPLAQSFERRITYYKKWKRFGVATLVMMLLFIPWDIWFTNEGVWWFNDDYTLGIKLFNLPLEEWLFFIVIPYACLFIYEVLNYFIKKDILKNIARTFLFFLSVILVICSAIYYYKLYTFITFLLTAIGVLITTYINPKWLSRFTLSYLVSLIPFLLINGILTGSLINEPVVNYNQNEILGIRLFNIPVEDSIYNLLMLLIVISIYESLNKTKKLN